MRSTLIASVSGTFVNRLTTAKLTFLLFCRVVSRMYSAKAEEFLTCDSDFPVGVEDLGD